MGGGGGPRRRGARPGGACAWRGSVRPGGRNCSAPSAPLSVRHCTQVAGRLLHVLKCAELVMDAGKVESAVSAAVRRRHDEQAYQPSFEARIPPASPLALSAHRLSLCASLEYIL